MNCKYQSRISGQYPVVSDSNQNMYKVVTRNMLWNCIFVSAQHTQKTRYENFQHIVLDIFIKCYIKDIKFQFSYKNWIIKHDIFLKLLFHSNECMCVCKHACHDVLTVLRNQEQPNWK